MENPPSPLVWLITGSSRGLGRSLALAALERGHQVIATARQASALEALTAAFPDACHALEMDVTRPDQVKEVIDQAAGIHGRLDVIVNNAGYGLTGALEELDDDQISRIFETNFFGALRVIRASLPHLRKQRRGHLVNISAAAAISNYPGLSVYGATKCALEGVSESLAGELKPLGIAVTVVQPGPFRTGFLGPGMDKAARSIGDYDATSGKFGTLLQSMHGRQTGDPDKAAAAILAAVGSSRPPFRLVLGKYAQDKVRKKLTATNAELELWGPAGLSTEFTASKSTPT